MIYPVAFFLSLVVTVTGQDCSICGDGLEVGNPDAIFTFAGQPEVPCGTLQDAGMSGQIPLEQCPFLPGLVGVCGCQAIPFTTRAPVASTPTTAPMSTPASAPIPAITGGCPAVPFSSAGCSVCGEGRCVGNPKAIFIYEGQPEVPCGELEQAGLDGQVPLEQCLFLPNLVSVCECGTEAAPQPSSSPTKAPVFPTTSPVVAIEPSPAPTPAPTPQPMATSQGPTPPPTVLSIPVPVVDAYGMGGAGVSGNAKDKGTMGMIQKANTSMAKATKADRRALGMVGSSPH